MFIVSESSDLLDMSGSLRESSKNSSNVSSWLHRDNSQLVFFIDPNEEGLVVVMEDTSSFGPVPV